MALRAGVGADGVLVWFGVVQVIGLGIPAGRQIGSRRTVDESGHGHGVRRTRVPLHGEWNELARHHGADHRLDVGGCQGRDQQDPVDAALVGPAGCQIGVGELDGRRGDTSSVECLALAQRPGGEQASGGAKHLMFKSSGSHIRRSLDGNVRVLRR